MINPKHITTPEWCIYKEHHQEEFDTWNHGVEGDNPTADAWCKFYNMSSVEINDLKNNPDELLARKADIVHNWFEQPNNKKLRPAPLALPNITPDMTEEEFKALEKQALEEYKIYPDKVNFNHIRGTWAKMQGIYGGG